MSEVWQDATGVPLGELQTRASRCNLLASAAAGDPRGVLWLNHSAGHVMLFHPVCIIVWSPLGVRLTRV